MHDPREYNPHGLSVNYKFFKKGDRIGYTLYGFAETFFGSLLNVNMEKAELTILEDLSRPPYHGKRV